jgi:hypothetical protein
MGAKRGLAHKRIKKSLCLGLWVEGGGAEENILTSGSGVNARWEERYYKYDFQNGPFSLRHEILFLLFIAV